LVVTVKARELIPYIADAVPGWFQPIITLYDAAGKEMAFNDDFRFKPDPSLYFEVPADGQYVLVMQDALYRGREDFVYRMTIGEVPFITSIFPLGCRAGEAVEIEMNGWNLDGAKLVPPPKGAAPGMYNVTAQKGKSVSNAVPFVVDTLPECMGQEPNDDPTQAQAVEFPVIVNGRIDRPGDWDVFQIQGHAGEILVAEVHARGLDSPLDSMLQIFDDSGTLLALNDDHTDPASGLNTHHADSYLMIELPSDGAYYVRLGDTAGDGGPEFGYRLRIGPPRPDFELRVVPSGGGLRSKSTVSPTVYIIRKDGFDGDVELDLKQPTEGFEARPVKLPAGNESVRFSLRTTLKRTETPVNLIIEGRALIGGEEVVHEAVPAEDRMQAFLWRHLVPSQQSMVAVVDPSYGPPSRRVAPELPEPPKDAPKSATPAKFTKRQVQGQLRRLKALYEDWLLTDEFYLEKVAECQAAL
jgi:hypothetical protein